MKCPVCEKGRLTKLRGDMSFIWQGRTVVAQDCEHCECDTCGADPVLEDQIRRNDERIDAAKKKYAFADTIAKHGETLRALSKV